MSIGELVHRVVGIAVLGLALSLAGCGRGVSDGGTPKGSTVLVYEVDADPTQPTSRETMQSLVAALTKRLDPKGKIGVSVRTQGDSRVEIQVPQSDELGVSRVKRLVGAIGNLRFRLTANAMDHAELFESARRQATEGDRLEVVKDSDGKAVGFWANVPREIAWPSGKPTFSVHTYGLLVRNATTGKLVEVNDRDIMQDQERYAEHVSSQGVEEIQVLIFNDDEYRVGGADIGDAHVDEDGVGHSCVAFTMSGSDAARRMGMLTGSNLPDGGFARNLGILLDDRLLVAPAIRGMITDRGQITGNFSRDEAEVLAAILRSGPLPVALKPDPVSESRVN